MSNFWFNYWWPSIKGNGPEDVTSLIIVGIIASIVIPKMRAWWVKREQILHAKLSHVMRQQAHLIKHSDVPNIAHDGVDLTADHEGNPLTQETK